MSTPKPQQPRATYLIWVAAALPLLLEVTGRTIGDPLFIMSGFEVLIAAVLVAAFAVSPALILRRRAMPARAAAAVFFSSALVLTSMASRILDATFPSSTRSGVIASILVSLLIAGSIAAGLAAALYYSSGKPAVRFSLACTALLCLIVLIGAGVRFVLETTPAKGSAPNVLLIIMDTTRADHLSVYGYRRPTTPNLEGFASSARVYEQAWSPSPWTPPSHACMLTGLLPAEHGYDGGAFTYPAARLPEVLRDAGYRTLSVVNNPQLGEGWQRGFDHSCRIWQHPTFSVSWLIWRVTPHDENEHYTGDTPRTLRIAQRWWGHFDSAPKFVMLNFVDPHSPYGDRWPQAGQFLDARTIAAQDLPDDSEEYDAGLVRASGAALDRLVALYDADIRFLDEHLGRFFEWLRQRGDLDRTIVVITADHGERLGERGLVGHQLGLDDALLRVPLLVRYPARVTAGRFAQPVQTHGIFETVLDLAGVASPGAPIARSPALDKQERGLIVGQMAHQGWYLRMLQKRNPAFDPSPFAGNWSSVSDRSWKLVCSTSGMTQLFDLTNDPTEFRNVAESHPEIVARLMSSLVQLPTFQDDVDPNPHAKIDPETLRRLRSLGYVGDDDGP